MALGPMLRQAREARGLSLEEVEDGTHIRLEHLVAIESERWDELPPDVFSRGLVRAYARAVGIDPSAALREYLKQRPNQPSLPEPQLLSRPLRRESRLSIDTLIGAAALIAAPVVLFVTYRTAVPWLLASQARQNEPTPTAPPLALAHTPTSPSVSLLNTPTAERHTVTISRPSPTATAGSGDRAAGIELEVQTTDRVWMRVTLDGDEGYEGILEVDTRHKWQAADSVTLRTGSAGGTRVWINGQSIGPLGQRGKVAELRWHIDSSGNIVQEGG